MTYRLQNLREFALTCPGAWDVILTKGHVDAPQVHVELDEAVLDGLKRSCQDATMVSPVQPPTALPEVLPQEWPALALDLKHQAKPEDKGLGDTVARLIGPIGGDAFKAWFEKTFDRACGCAERQEWLNSVFPYD